MVAALVHFWVTADHFKEWWGYGAFFLITAGGQAFYAWILLRRPGRRYFLLGIVGNLAIVVLYVLTRTIGVPVFGPHAGEVEGVGTLDLLATGAESTLVVLLAALLLMRRDQLTPDRASGFNRLSRPVSRSPRLSATPRLSPDGAGRRDGPTRGDIAEGLAQRPLLPLVMVAACVLLAMGGLIKASSIDPLHGERLGGRSSETPPDCSGTSAFRCYRQHYRSLARDSGGEAALLALAHDAKTNGFLASKCHELAHVIGRAAGDARGHLSGTDSQDPNFCNAGYHHGVMEAFVAKSGVESILKAPDTVCADLRHSDKYSIAHHNCAHGLGHGLMRTYKHELFKSLKGCDALRDTWERNECYSGVFMEGVMAQASYLDADRPLYPCSVLATRYRTPCFLYQSQYTLQTRGNDFLTAFDLCARAEPDSRRACYQGVGGAAAGDSVQQSLGDLAEVNSVVVRCRLGRDFEVQSACIDGAARQFIVLTYSGTGANAFCEALTDRFRAVCIRAAEEQSRIFGSL
ncbi:MAG: hypothetical protein M3198_04585 [Actinomycetota bacterium]|nr:hypothetical protein [Actinomycetota bacterium]